MVLEGLELNLCRFYHVLRVKNLVELSLCEKLLGEDEVEYAAS